MKNKDNIFYVYRWIRLDTNTPFYVGKGRKNRYKQTYNRNDRFNRIRNKVSTKCEIFISNLKEKESFKKEIEFIKLYKSFGFCEANLTDGGEGLSGYKPSEESNKKRSYSMKGRLGKPLSDETKRKLSEFNTGKIAWNKGLKTSPRKQESIDKAVNTFKSNKRLIGIPRSEETKRKISNALKGRVSWNKGKESSEETKIKSSKSHIGQKAYNKGKVYSDEERLKNAAAHGSKLFEVYDIQNNFIDEWVNKSECARVLKLTISCISECLSNKSKHHKGYTFKYKEEI